MRDFYEKNKIVLDFVYTAKMMFGINDLIKKEYFSSGSRILAIHTGGLQGNKSLTV
jgi:1-aminocyclopropane-1-carboxylate deaminase